MKNSEIQNHYKILFETYGDNIESTQQKDREQQNNRFSVFLRNPYIGNNDRVADFGCGLGDLYNFFKQNELNVKYHGYDFVPEIIENNNKKFQLDSDVKFSFLNIENIDDFPTNYDWGIISGVFNNKREDSIKFYQSVIKTMYLNSKKGVMFNMLTTYVDYYDENLDYFDPKNVFDFCKKELGAKVALINDYEVNKNVIPFEFTIFVNK